MRCKDCDIVSAMSMDTCFEPRSFILLGVQQVLFVIDIIDFNEIIIFRIFLFECTIDRRLRLTVCVHHQILVNQLLTFDPVNFHNLFLVFFISLILNYSYTVKVAHD